MLACALHLRTLPTALDGVVRTAVEQVEHYLLWTGGLDAGDSGRKRQSLHADWPLFFYNMHMLLGSQRSHLKSQWFTPTQC